MGSCCYPARFVPNKNLTLKLGEIVKRLTNHLRRIWEQLRGSLWFIPSLAMLAAIALAAAMVTLDRTIGPELISKVPLVFEAGPEGARQVLSTIAGSVLTVSGVVFSFTILAFSLASSQYSPRILYNFMEDRTNQIVLGVLLGSFVYCLLVLRTVKLEDSSIVSTTFVPSLSVTAAILLALLDLGLFIFYLHHIATSITAYHIINRVGEVALSSVEHTFTEEPAPQEHSTALTERPAPNFTEAVRATAAGYLQEIDLESLARLAAQHNSLVEVSRRVGDFVTDGKLLARLAVPQPLSQEARSHFIDAFVLGARRTQQHDPLFALTQLCDVALKALSPGINDPTTALMCLDQIERVLSRAATLHSPTRVQCDSSGAQRVFSYAVSFSELADQAFQGIRHYGVAEASDVRLACKLLEVMAAIAEQTADMAHHAVLYSHAFAVVDAADRALVAPADRTMLNSTLASLSEGSLPPNWELPPLKVSQG
ncbi:MAG: DUF2254 domain-containing protein [Chloroflexota bacterium]